MLGSACTPTPRTTASSWLETQAFRASQPSAPVPDTVSNSRPSWASSWPACCSRAALCRPSFGRRQNVLVRIPAVPNHRNSLPRTRVNARGGPLFLEESRVFARAGGSAVDRWLRDRFGRRGQGGFEPAAVLDHSFPPPGRPGAGIHPPFSLCSLPSGRAHRWPRPGEAPAPVGHRRRPLLVGLAGPGDALEVLPASACGLSHDHVGRRARV